MIQTSERFREHVARALTDSDLKVALNRTTGLLADAPQASDR